MDPNERVVLESGASMAKFISQKSQTYPNLAKFAPFADAMQVVAGAALQKLGVTPSSVQQAFDLLGSDAAPPRIREGLLKGNMGITLKVDAQQVLAEGELDAQCADDLLLAAESICEFGIELDPDDDLLIRIPVALRRFGQVERGRAAVQLSETGGGGE